MIVGLTGGIGSGKTTVARIFSRLKVPVFEADVVSKSIIDEDRQLQSQLQQLLGEEVVEAGKINRPFMAQRIFSDEQLLEKTNALIHPAVADNFRQWYAGQDAPYVIREAAILFESGSYKDCQQIVVVTAPREMRIQRVMERNALAREEVLARMNRQWPEERKLERADFVVQNDHSQSLIKQVLRIHENLIRIANKKG